MFYNGYYFGGMHLVWWLIFLMFLIWVFVLPYPIPGQRWKGDSPLDILTKRLARGEINTQQYEERKKVLENDLAGHV